MVQKKQTNVKAGIKKNICFQIKKNDDGLLEAIGEALRIGFESYKNSGWL